MRPGTTSNAPPPLSAPCLAWHSPVPYLFIGLAAMLGLIAFALLILACSYWKLSAHIYGGGGAAAAAASATKHPSSPPPSFVVVMAGNDKPTYIATPMRSRAADEPTKAGGGGGGECAATAPGGEGTRIEPNRDYGQVPSPNEEV